MKAFKIVAAARSGIGTIYGFSPARYLSVINTVMSVRNNVVGLSIFPDIASHSQFISCQSLEVKYCGIKIFDMMGKEIGKPGVRSQRLI